MNKITILFDLDETVIDSKHRTPSYPDGTLNLPAYVASHTPENVANDRLMPLAGTMRRMIEQGYNVAILTARDMKECDYEFLRKHGIHADFIMSRDKTFPAHYQMRDGEYKAKWLQMMNGCFNGHLVMFDDSPPVKSALRKMGVSVICAHKANARIRKTSAVD